MKAEKVLHIGLVGAGLMGAWHAAAAEKAGGKIVGICDSDEKKSQKLANRYSTAKVFNTAAEMIADNFLDVLHICTPTETHLEIARLALRNEVNLFIEKPLAESADDVINLYKLAAENGATICPAHQFPFQDGVRQAKSSLPRLGEIAHLQANVCSAGSEIPRASAPDAIAADILPHPLSLFQFILGVLLPTDGWQVLRPRQGEWRVMGQAGKTSLGITISMNARPTVNSLEIFGTRGKIYTDLFHGFEFSETGKVSKSGKILHPFESAYKHFSAAALNLARRAVRSETAYPGLRRLINEFYLSVREKQTPPISPEQAINIAIIRDRLINYNESKALQNKLS